MIELQTNKKLDQDLVYTIVYHTDPGAMSTEIMSGDIQVSAVTVQGTNVDITFHGGSLGQHCVIVNNGDCYPYKHQVTITIGD